jgi:hypothetical protein
MSKIIMGIQLEKRQNAVSEVQALLSEYGCYIRTRLGVHEAAEDTCSEKGLIILEFIDAKQDVAKELEEKLKKVRQVKVKTMEF